jgi:MFS family permease
MTMATGRDGDRSEPRLGRAVTAALWAVILVLAAGGLAGILLPATLTQDSEPIASVLSATITLLFGGVGALVVNRQPRNAVGWLLWLTGALVGVSMASTAFAVWSLGAFAAQPLAAVLAAWITQWAFSPTLVLALLVLPLLFPDGRLPSRRWRWAMGFAVLATVAAGLPDMLRPGLLGPTAIPNPTAWTGDPAPLDALRAFNAISPILALPVVVASAVVRYRRGSAIEHQQLKWFGATAALAVVSLSVAVVAPEPIGVLGFFGAMVAVALMPVAIGIAILRYRLYAIDRLVSRSISWAIVTGTLVVAFVGLVFGLQTLLAPLTGEDGLAVAASTLVVAALFQPLRSRVQRTVDRRFDRSRYDGERLALAFATRLRDEVDLVTVGADLTRTAHAALVPASIALWVRVSGDGR